MLRNYLAVAVRNLLRHKLYSLINLVGLAVGLAGTLLKETLSPAVRLSDVCRRNQSGSILKTSPIAFWYFPRALRPFVVSE
ncbi:MAG: hypothetical protein HN559_24330 [Gemmatimonadetes bacterium]|jgi:hypothetical protein|nr:hypothetical protein [Gemmatimonadota bacterium]MBT5145824.1 hypothetical protein [Gemmatimonadota bacterium]MBT7598055.1 hypothetical protein [Gemmatimonadota bacterium]